MNFVTLFSTLFNLYLATIMKGINMKTVSFEMGAGVKGGGTGRGAGGTCPQIFSNTQKVPFLKVKSALFLSKSALLK